MSSATAAAGTDILEVLSEVIIRNSEVHFGTRLLLVEFAKSTGPACETGTVQCGAGGARWGCSAQGMCEAGAATRCWEPWQRRGDAAAAPGR